MDLNTVTLRHPRTLVRLAFRKLLRIVRGETATPATAEEVTADPGEPLIDPKALIAQYSIEELNRTAEVYFSSLASWDYHLAKPFSTVADAPGLLINFATMLQGLRLKPGVKVLDFGAGTGWTSRYLTQLGCEVIVLDVSETALEIAREVYRRQPVIGDQPAPRFLHYDGRGIDLPDASVERILCFDAFHHAPNPHDVLREFARILTPGGIAAFAEPGPEHSKTAQSQHEMRTYGVLENDVDIHALWKTAREAGFSEIELAAYNVPRFAVPLEKYDELLAGGETYLRWSELTRAFLGNVRNFFLKREGEEALDSRGTEGLEATIAIDAPVQALAGEPIPVRATVTNSGRATWLASPEIPGGVSLGCHLVDAGGQVKAHDYHWQPLTDPPRRIAPGETVDLQFNVPALQAGRWTLEFDCVADRVCWFAQVGSKAVKAEIDIDAG